LPKLPLRSPYRQTHEYVYKHMYIRTKKKYIYIYVHTCIHIKVCTNKLHYTYTCMYMHTQLVYTCIITQTYKNTYAST
jgi:hypothetical protein